VKYRLRHVTEYAYATPVDLASHMLHLSPRALPLQAVEEARIVANPQPSRTVRARDHFGNDATWLFLDQPHERFSVSLDALVAVTPPPAAADAATPSWEVVARLAASGGTNAAHAEFVFPSPLVPAEPAARAYAEGCFAPGRPLLACLRELTKRIRNEFAFRPGVTDVSTPVARVLAQKEGVCQDFTHLMIAALRGFGLPARYVSGYLRTRPPPGQPRRRGADQSHAWVAAWLGPEHGWVGLDPTNDLVVADEHVVLAWGRDYGDISPIRGVLLGGGQHSVRVSVDLEAL
jgi:transglutaminase-like putative cysteine protease